jgi:predicted AlkP superfamily phosphohydrolase/phosphomutase
MPRDAFRRRLARVLAGGAVIVCAFLCLGCNGRAETTARRVIVLGFDGFDYKLTSELMRQGRLPNFARLAQTGSFSSLASTIPPQSPVAWSSFITGRDPGGHGIFDFIHRDPETMVPFLSTTNTTAGSVQLKLGRWQFPLNSGKVELLRRGEPFWEVLKRAGIPSTIFRIPANFPPSGTATRELSGMGTPDLLGTYGTFSYYTSDGGRFEGADMSGGAVYPVTIANGVVSAEIYGPDNPFLRDPVKVRTPLTVYVDERNPVAKIVVGSEERIVREGEWSDWVPVVFEPIPFQHVNGMCRFYLKQLRPTFEMYVSPVNLDPLAPMLPLSSPRAYASEVAAAIGRFHTQGIPEDTKSVSAGVLSPDEFLEQARAAADDVKRQYQYVLDHYHGGLLFFYFGNVDQTSHMMWRSMDPEHPAYKREVDAKYRDVIPRLYEELDGIVGRTLERLGDDGTLIVMSDHGFTSWRRSFHLNSWLRDNGYLTVIDPKLNEDPGFFANIDWSHTRAYALGLNGLYINLEGRERYGIVPPSERDGLLKEIGSRLLAATDPKSGEHAVARVFERDQVYQHADPRIAPDLVIGYARGVRSSNESSLGGVPREIMSDNTDAWSGDHCMDPAVVPGILLTNRHLREPVSSLQGLGRIILDEFGLVGAAGHADRE